MSAKLEARITKMQAELDDLKKAVQKPVFRTVKIGNLEWQVDCPEPMTWEEAKKYAASLGDGWRLPTVQELVSLWDYDTGACAAFPEADGWYWSSSPHGALHAWRVGFVYGAVGNSSRDGQYGVRCVR